MDHPQQPGQKMNKKPREDVSQVLRGMVGFSRIWPSGPGQHLEIDLLERAIELYRIQHRVLENQIAFEEFLQMAVKVDPVGKLLFEGPPKFGNMGAGTPAVALQPALLVQLLLDYQVPRPVLEQIESFIDHIWNQLDVLDFKKTKTGVFRCFTNTRFAANTLRNYGLLRFTKKERHKTWRLSALGVVVAARVFDEVGWRIINEKSAFPVDTNNALSHALRGLWDSQNVLRALHRICEEREENYRRFQALAPVLANALEQFAGVLSNEEINKDDRHKRCSEIVNWVEVTEEFTGFENQLAMSLRTEEIERALNQERP